MPLVAARMALVGWACDGCYHSTPRRRHHPSPASFVADVWRVVCLRVYVLACVRACLRACVRACRIKYISPIKYAFEAYMVTEFSTLTLHCNPGEFQVRVP